MYATYPTRQLTEQDRLTLAIPLDQIQLLLQHDLNTYAHDVLMPPQGISTLLSSLAEQGEATIASLFAHFPTQDKPSLWRTVAWLQKLGIIRNAEGRP